MRVDVEVRIPFNIDSVWRWAGGYNLLPTISTACVTSVLEDGGRVRVLTNTDGSIIWERLLSYDEKAKSLSYRIEDSKAFTGPYDVGYVGRVALSADGDSATVFQYSGSFEPVQGVTEDQARLGVVNFAEDCAKGIERVLRRGAPNGGRGSSGV